jgi:iron(III) transport system substrate-binding protein
LFLDYMLSKPGQASLARHRMNPLRTDVPKVGPQPDPSSIKAIRVGPALLVNLDQMKKAKFVRDWKKAVPQAVQVR